MRQILTIVLLMVTLLQADIVADITKKAKNIGRQTPVDIELYAKNPSHICSLSIKNITNPYKKDITKDKLPVIKLEPGRYFRADISDILKGGYEFEYAWDKSGKFVDSSLRRIHIFAYHDTRSKLHKKVNLTFLLRSPQGCR